MRKTKELDEVVSMLSKLIKSEGSKRVVSGRIREVLEELKKGERLSRKRMGQLIREISQALCDEVLKHKQSETGDD